MGHLGRSGCARLADGEDDWAWRCIAGPARPSERGRRWSEARLPARERAGRSYARGSTRSTPAAGPAPNGSPPTRATSPTCRPPGGRRHIRCHPVKRSPPPARPAPRRRRHHRRRRPLPCPCRRPAPRPTRRPQNHPRPHRRRRPSHHRRRPGRLPPSREPRRSCNCARRRHRTSVGPGGRPADRSRPGHRSCSRRVRPRSLRGPHGRSRIWPSQDPGSHSRRHDGYGSALPWWC
jgi:hypothetical protein